MRKFILFVSMGLCAACSWAGVKVELKGFDNDSVQVRWYNPVSRASIAQDSLVVSALYPQTSINEPAHRDKSITHQIPPIEATSVRSSRLL